MLFPHGDKSAESMRKFPQFTMALCCIYCMYVTITKSQIILKTRLFKPFLLFSILGLLYVCYPLRDFSFFYNNVLYFLKSFMAIYFMFVVYLYLLKDYNKTKNYIYMIYGLQIIYAFHKLYTDRLIFLSSEHEVFDSNAGFILICLLPMSLIIPLRRLRIYLCAIIVLGCIYSGQRSAALAATLCFPLCIAYLKGCIKRMDILIFVLAFVFVAKPILQDAITNIEMRNSLDIQKDNFGSGRSEFWADVWNAFWNGNIFQILFGHGANSVPELLVVKYGISIWSHNGWLDALYMYGFVGFVIYGCIVLRLYQYNRKISHTLKNYKNIFLIIFLLFMVKSTTSHGNWDISVMPLVIAIAIVMVDYKKCSLSLQ